jgi:hypothetical protein
MQAISIITGIRKMARKQRTIGVSCCLPRQQRKAKREEEEE